MRIKRVEVTNYRALRNAAVNLSDATALIGENNCGKSAFLLALDLFFSSSPRVGNKDFSDGNIDEPINITVHFSSLTPYDREEFEGNLIDDALIVTRRFYLNSSSENGKYFISARVNPEFNACRNEPGKSEKRKLYADLRDKYQELPKEKNADEIDAFLQSWEAANPDALKVERIAAFKGWTNVAAGKMKQKTNYVLIRAVQNAAEDIQESKSSPVKSLVDTIARQTIENSDGYKSFIADANQKISELTDPVNVPILADISSGLTSILSDYYKHSEIIASWEPVTQLHPTFPSANIAIKDNEFVAGLDGVGHGLQRAVILTVLRFMADHRAMQEASGKQFFEPQSDLIVAIEEPELYQHPIKQRLFGKLLPKLSAGFNKQTGIRVQTIYVTHSPLMISIGECEGIRMVRRENGEEKKNVLVSEISLNECSNRSAEVSGLTPEQAWSATQFAAKLHTFGSEIAEGFFAKCVLLVEGVGDKAIMEAWYRINDRDPHAEGVVIAEVSGKNNLSKPIIVFQALGIPCFWLFDNDKSGKKQKKEHSAKANRILQHLGGRSTEDCVDWPEGCFEQLAVWDNKLEDYICNKVGKDRFDDAAIEFSKHFDIDQDMCLKFPASASGMLHRFRSQGVEFSELDEIVKAVDNLMA